MSGAAPAAATVYVYYRIDPAQRDALRAAVAGLLEAMRTQAGVAGRWMQRRDDPQTCMEVYEAVDAPEAFLARLDAQARRAGFERLLAPGAARRTEVFVAAR